MSAHWSMSVYTLGPRSGCHDVPCAGLSWHPEARSGQGRCTRRPTTDHRPTAALFNRRLQSACAALRRVRQTMAEVGQQCQEPALFFARCEVVDAPTAPGWVGLLLSEGHAPRLRHCTIARGIAPHGVFDRVNVLAAAAGFLKVRAGAERRFAVRVD